jgi:uncharacterized protein DUF6573
MRPALYPRAGQPQGNPAGALRAALTAGLSPLGSRRGVMNGPNLERSDPLASNDLPIITFRESPISVEGLLGPVLHRVTRKDLLREGILVDVSTLAAQAGFIYPVAVGRSVWDAYVAVPPGVSGQDETGRLWDILRMLSVAVRRSDEGSLIRFYLLVRNDNWQPRPVRLKALCGPGDDAEPVITILLPDED